MNKKHLKNIYAPGGTSLKQEGIYYLICGVTNSLITWLIYCIALHVLHYMIAYTISFITGVLISYYLNKHLVFKASTLPNRFGYYLPYYVSQYAICLGLMNVLIRHGIGEFYAPWLVLGIVTPINFLLIKCIFRRKNV